MNKSIWCLFSVNNDYNQPDNNLVAWWFEKPSFEILAEVIGVKFEGEENILNIIFIHQGKARRVRETEYRLRNLDEGEVKENINEK